MLIRKMTLEDVKAVAEIEKKCFSQPWSEKSFEDSITRDDTIFLVCEENANDAGDEEQSNSQMNVEFAMGKAATIVVGYVGMYLSFDEASITNVAVSPKFRKKGYGEQLLIAAQNAAKATNAETIFLEVRVSNEPAVSLYKKVGFEELGIRKKFYEHPVEDAIIMSCGLSGSK